MIYLKRRPQLFETWKFQDPRTVGERKLKGKCFEAMKHSMEKRKKISGVRDFK